MPKSTPASTSLRPVAIPNYKNTSIIYSFTLSQCTTVRMLPTQLVVPSKLQTLTAHRKINRFYRAILVSGGEVGGIRPCVVGHRADQVVV
uniref:Uncharacterized protein n=1 Tax=Physcomitrium patens TaxID=3218 RepID=A0A2K1KHV8_PHYPA|nr:hypothetical protein PHYPA_007033 [Physcomitrium patens]